MAISFAKSLRSSLQTILRGGSDAAFVEWRVLVLDERTRDILNTLFKVGDLRKTSITLHFLLHSERSPIPDAPAVYFVSPTKENVVRVAEDCKAGLYKAFHLHFCSSLPYDLMQTLAEGLISAPPSVHVTVYDHQTSFVALENDLFSLQIPNCFRSLYSPKAEESAIDALMSKIADGLLGVMLSLQAVPIICNTLGGPAEQVALKLRVKLADAFAARDLAPSISGPRPLILLFDRASDVSTLVHHPWSYRALMHDRLHTRLNVVHLPAENASAPAAAAGAPGGATAAASAPPAKGKRVELEMIGGSDPFWSGAQGQPFSAVIEGIGAEVDAYKAATKRLGTADVLEAGKVDEIQQQSLRKRFLDAHTQLLRVLDTQIQSGRLDLLHHLEAALMSKSDAFDRSLFVGMLRGTAKEFSQLSVEDKLRAAVVYVWARGSDSAVSDFVQSVKMEHPADYDRVSKVIERTISDRNLAMREGGPGGHEKGGAGARDWLLKLSSTVVDGLWRKGDVQMLPLTRLVAELLTPERADARDQLPLDAWDARNRVRVDLSQLRLNVCIAFAVGGGNYTEYQNLRDWDASRAGFSGRRSVYYGTTDIVNPKEFVDQVRVGGAYMLRCCVVPLFFGGEGVVVGVGGECDDDFTGGGSGGEG